MAAHYDLCQDMASMLTETAKNMFLSLGITEDDVLIQCDRGLTSEGAVVTVNWLRVLTALQRKDSPMTWTSSNFRKAVRLNRHLVF